MTKRTSPLRSILVTLARLVTFLAIAVVATGAFFVGLSFVTTLTLKSLMEKS